MLCDGMVLQNLLDAGCGEELVARYRELAESELPKCACARKQAELLCAYRRELLERLHEDQRRLECLDYLLFKLREDKEK